MGGGVRLNLPEAVRAVGAGMAIENFQLARYFLVSCVYYRARHGWARRKVFKTEVLGWMENATLNLVFTSNRAMILIFKEEFAEFAELLLDIPLHPESTKGSPWLGKVIKISKLRFSVGLINAIFRMDFTITVFHKRAMLLIFYSEHTVSVLDILSYPKSTMAHHGWAWRKFQYEGSQQAGKRYFKISFCKYSKCFLQLYVLSTVVQALCSIQLYKNYLTLMM